MTMLAAVTAALIGTLWVVEIAWLLVSAKGLMRSEGASPPDPAR
jgi:hypothetical protein